MTEQTALDWFFRKIIKTDNNMKWLEYLEEAKQKEKEQIENASRIGYMSGMEKPTFDDSIIKAFSEKYYKITFNK